MNVNGGIRLEYQVVIRPDQKSKIPVEIARQKIMDVLSRRVSEMGIGESMVAPKGEDHIIVEIPGVNNIDGKQAVIGSSARIEFYHARNVVSSQDQNRKYSPIFSENAKNPLVSFIRNSDKKEIKPGTEDYKDVIGGWSLILAGTDIAMAQANPKGDSYEPMMDFSREGTRKMTAWSNVYFGKEESIAVVLDGNVLSIASVQREARLDSNCVINGTFTPEYVKNLVSLVNGGSLPAGLKLLGASIVSPAK